MDLLHVVRGDLVWVYNIALVIGLYHHVRFRRATRATDRLRRMQLATRWAVIHTVIALVIVLLSLLAPGWYVLLPVATLAMSGAILAMRVKAHLGEQEAARLAAENAPEPVLPTLPPELDAETLGWIQPEHIRQAEANLDCRARENP